MKVNLIFISIYLLVFLFGGSLGSFYKVFVERRERGEDFIFLRSHCESCKKSLKFYEMIPVFSYIFLRGKCSSCGEKIGRENFYLEVLTSLLALLVFMRYKISLETLIVIVILIIAFFIGIIEGDALGFTFFFTKGRNRIVLDTITAHESFRKL